MSEKYVEVILQGGLGNQMFQYSAGLALLKKNEGNSLYLNCSLIASKTTDLLDFNLCPEARLGSAPKVTTLFKNKKNIFKESDFYFNPGFELLNPSITIDGYFQSPKYFRGFEADINKSFQLKTDSFLPTDVTGSNSPLCAIHIRRGDYFSNSQAFKIHGTLGLDYFHKAIKLIRKIISQDTTFVVFSDDVEYARANMTDGDFFFVEPNKTSPAFDLILMSKCQNFIISNSTYSWWAAFIGQHGMGVTIAPVNWFSRDFLLKNPAYDLFPREWMFI